ncbi:MAG TPA: NeuD/PglB/VioB family sugar acetyltransferase [Cyclobacteriaceae bacterium]
MSKISIVGSGGHSRSVIGLIQDAELQIEGIYDKSYNPKKNETIMGLAIKGTLEELPEKNLVILAVGNNLDRNELFNRYFDRIFQENISHSSAILQYGVTLGVANLVFPRSFINAEVTIGDNNIINTGTIIEHESTIENHCHISIGSIIAGRVSIGDRCFIGAGVIIKDQVKICSDVIIGAGSLVVKDIDEPGVYIGSPVKKIT